jgi:hypothetical protein
MGPKQFAQGETNLPQTGDAPTRLPLGQARLVRITEPREQYRDYPGGLLETQGIRERYSYAVNGLERSFRIWLGKVRHETKHVGHETKHGRPCSVPFTESRYRPTVASSPEIGTAVRKRA